MQMEWMFTCCYFPLLHVIVQIREEIRNQRLSAEFYVWKSERIIAIGRVDCEDMGKRGVRSS